MANRRMFSLRIVDTDNFLDMPIGARLLYYDLSMRADDDGFVDNPKKIMKIIGCAEDDYKVLVVKRYLIPFESGVCVIKHWRMHNIIRVDRYHETDYKNEKSQLNQIDNRYELSGTQNVIPNDNQLEPQVRLGKVRLDKDIKKNIQKENYTDEFEIFWSFYPKRLGDGSSKIRSYKKWKARIRDGIKANLIIEAAQRYQLYCAITGISDTEYIYKAENFLADDKNINNLWEGKTNVTARRNETFTEVGERMLTELRTSVQSEKSW